MKIDRIRLGIIFFLIVISCRKPSEHASYIYVRVLDDKTGLPIEGARASNPDISTLYGVSDSDGLMKIVIRENSVMNIHFTAKNYSSSPTYYDMSGMPSIIYLKHFGYIKLNFSNSSTISTNWVWLMKMNDFSFTSVDMSGPDTSLFYTFPAFDPVDFKYSLDSVPDWFSSYQIKTVNVTSHDTSSATIYY